MQRRFESEKFDKISKCLKWLKCEHGGSGDVARRRQTIRQDSELK